MDDEYSNWLVENSLTDDAHFGRDQVSQQLEADFEARPWELAIDFLKALDCERTPVPEAGYVSKLADAMPPGGADSVTIVVPPYEEYREELLSLPASLRKHIIFSKNLPEPMDDDEYHDRLTEVWNSCFGNAANRPEDPDDQDEFDLIKLKLERKIARVARDPETLTKVAERYYSFAQIKPRTRDKYRRTLKRLMCQTGDIPLKHLTPDLLRGFRDYLAGNGNLAASIRADFTPIIGMLNFAVDEGMLDASPMSGVRLPKAKRSVEESKWLPFTPEEMQQILNGAEEVWSKDVPGLSADRREGLRKAVRALAYTAMRPSELLALAPDDVDDICIRIRGGKTKSAWRVIPLHPAISDIPRWVKSGGLDTFNNRTTGDAQTDPVTPLRHNFKRLITDFLDELIIGERKALYSLRSTFQNSMKRAGAPISVRKAIMGHVEKGAIRHYDDGPEFTLMQKWVCSADPALR